MIDLRHNPTRSRSGHDGSVPGGSMLRNCDNGRTDDRRLLLVLMLVEDDLRRQVVIRELAAAVNLSSGRLAHLFKSEVGISPQRYLNNLRMEKAKELLENGLLSVKEIATEVGVPNASHFCRSFKVRYGMTPKEYRKTHLKTDLKSLGAFAFAG